MAQNILAENEKSNNTKKTIADYTLIGEYNMKTMITVECAKSKNFQKHSVGMQLEIEHETVEELEAQIAKYQAVCRKKVMEQIQLD